MQVYYFYFFQLAANINKISVEHLLTMSSGVLPGALASMWLFVWSGACGEAGSWSGVSSQAGMAYSATVADGIEETAIAGVTGVTAGQRVAQTGLLVGDAATR